MTTGINDQTGEANHVHLTPARGVTLWMTCQCPSIVKPLRDKQRVFSLQKQHSYKSLSHDLFVSSYNMYIYTKIYTINNGFSAVKIPGQTRGIKNNTTNKWRRFSFFTRPYPSVEHSSHHYETNSRESLFIGRYHGQESPNFLCVDVEKTISNHSS